MFECNTEVVAVTETRGAGIIYSFNTISRATCLHIPAHS